jgi:hypothetical protein
MKIIPVNNYDSGEKQLHCKSLLPSQEANLPIATKFTKLSVVKSFILVKGIDYNNNILYNPKVLLE